MYKWYLPTLSEILAVGEPTSEPGHLQGFRSPAQQQLRAEREWSGAIAALKQLLQQILEFNQFPSTAVRSPAVSVTSNHKKCPAPKGMVLSGPFPVLDQPELLENFAAWTFTVGVSGEVPLQLLPAATEAGSMTDMAIPTLPLLSTDPLAAEQFCLVLTETFSLVLVLGESPEQEPAFLFSFHPTVVQQAWRSLQARLRLAAPYALPPLDGLVEQFVPKAPDYQVVAQFSRLMLANLPHPSDLEEKRVIPSVSQTFQGVAQSLTAPGAKSASVAEAKQPFLMRSPSTSQLGNAATSSRKSANGKVGSGKMGAAKAGKNAVQGMPDGLPDPIADGMSNHSDTELLQAIAHEVRTPLTTIRTLTRLLLRRKDLSPDVIKRLEVIDRECTEQIDRFSLIFRAVELETANGKNSLASLAPISLAQVLQQTVPRWQQQASQHSHTLEVNLPQKLPMVVTDPTMLDQVLTGLVDRFTHSLPPGSHIQMQVSQAGHQLKLQLESHPQASSSGSGEVGAAEKSKFGFAPTLKSLGQLLMFQPETGNLSLSMAVTKNLFQALGGKLIVKQRPHQGEVLTIFLPLENRKAED